VPDPRRTRLIGFGLLAAMLAHHWGLWLLMTQSRGLSLATILNRWDAEHYSAIATSGYDGTLWAFFPLYPSLAGALARVTTLPPFVAGCLISTAALIAFVGRSCRPAESASQSLQASPWGLFLLLYGPASFVLHTHHTEGLFLLLSFAALSFAVRTRPLPAAAFAGLALWTRVQGAVLALATIIILIHRVKDGALPRSRLLLAAGIVGAFGLGFLGFEWSLGGSPFAFLHAQESWTHAGSLWDVVRALWLGNPWQNTSLGSLERHAWFFLCLGLSIAFMRKERVLGGYALLSVLLIFSQAEFVNVFRYTAVLFPLWFWAGRGMERWPRWAQLPVAVALIALNHFTAHRYALGMWSY
jgi:hypothetical protein